MVPQVKGSDSFCYVKSVITEGRICLVEIRRRIDLPKQTFIALDEQAYPVYELLMYLQTNLFADKLFICK